MHPDDPRHGTRAGYQTHLRHHEPSCPPCLRAAADSNMVGVCEECGNPCHRRSLRCMDCYLAPPVADDAVIERILAGEWKMPANQTERAEVARRWHNTGRSLYQLRQLTGWKVERYYRVNAA